MPTDVLLSNIAWLHVIAKMSHAWWASQRDLRDPGRGILGFGAAVWFVLLDTLQDLAPWSGVFLIWFCARYRNSLAHKLPAPLALSLSVLISRFCGFCFVCFALFLCFLSFEPDKTSDCMEI